MKKFVVLSVKHEHPDFLISLQKILLLFAHSDYPQAKQNPKNMKASIE
jgi:hypothetical protein